MVKNTGGVSFFPQRVLRFAGIGLVGLGLSAVWAGQGSGGSEPAAGVVSVADLTARVKASLVTLRTGAREGGDAGVGTGFCVGEGLIATNAHVIRQGRQIKVEATDGKEREVVAVEAFEESRDLALLRVSGPELPALPLLSAQEAEALVDGTPLVVVGNPQGLRSSVVEGVLSARRELEEFAGVQLLQIAMPIEPGNSGSPAVDRQGRVVGVVTMRSRGDSIGFAMPVAALHTLMAQTNPVPMARWLTIGAIDPKRWKTVEGRWTQRAGIIRGGGGGSFGGRALCVSQQDPPPLPYEVAVKVKLDDESGAGGLIFCSDGGDIHYGFYPSNGRIKLALFEGPDLGSWRVFHEVKAPSYKPGAWNDLRVRVAETEIQCWVNGDQIFSQKDTTLRTGRPGVCKFRQSEPEFKEFRVGTDLSPRQELEGWAFFDRQASILEEQAQKLRTLGRSAHGDRVGGQMRRLFEGKEESAIDLIHAALLIAQLDQPELDIDHYRDYMDQLVAQFKEFLGPSGETLSWQERLAKLDQFFFRENGFHGARFETTSRANSYMSDVLDDREGLPITLSVLYMELGRRGAKLPLEGVNHMSESGGRFFVRCAVPEGEPRQIDVFGGGVAATFDGAVESPMATKSDIIVRMLNNLRSYAVEREKFTDALRYVRLGLVVAPEDGSLRLNLALLAAQEQQWDEAKAAAAWLLEKRPDGLDVDRLFQLKDMIDERARQ